MLRYTAYLGINTNDRADLSVFADGDSVPAWAKEAMSWAVSVGIISGTRIGNHLLLDPFGRATRAQVASIQMRYVENIIKPAQAVVLFWYAMKTILLIRCLAPTQIPPVQRR